MFNATSQSFFQGNEKPRYKLSLSTLIQFKKCEEETIGAWDEWLIKIATVTLACVDNDPNSVLNDHTKQGLQKILEQGFSDKPIKEKINFCNRLIQPKNGDNADDIFMKEKVKKALNIYTNGEVNLELIRIRMGEIEGVLKEQRYLKDLAMRGNSSLSTSLDQPRGGCN